MPIACLPWYELPETVPAQDALWQVLALHLRRHSVADIPERLTHDAPVPAVLTDPALMFGQCCGYDIVYGLAGSVIPVATPCYAAEGCQGPAYRSFVLVRDGDPAGRLADLRGRTCAVNGFNSHSGTNALRALVAPLSEDGRFFSEVKVSGGHVRSLALLAVGEADVMAMDCVVHALLTRHRPEALAGTRVLARTDAAPAPPFVTSVATDGETVDRLRAALTDALADGASRAARETMLLDGAEILGPEDYLPILTAEAAALARGYTELHATSPALQTARGATGPSMRKNGKPIPG